MFKKDTLKIKILNENIKMPHFSTPGSSGFDVYSPNDYEIKPHEDVLIPLGFALEMPKGYDAVVHNRSSVASKKKLIVGAHLIDNDYRGEVHAHLINFSNNTIKISKDEKITQFVFRKYKSDFKIVLTSELSNTKRGSGGFGSTNKAT